MKFAIADPPYLGCGALHYGKQHEQAADCDNPAWHEALIERLCCDYPDGWALCLHTPSLRVILPMCPTDCRVGAWTKPFCIFRPNVNPAFAWEPLIWRGGRRRTRQQDHLHDFVSVSTRLGRGLVMGAKPPEWTRWVLGLLNAQPEDEIDDLFPGSGAVTDAIGGWKEAAGLQVPTLGLFGEVT